MIERGGPNPFIARRTSDDKQTVTSSSGGPLVEVRSDKGRGQGLSGAGMCDQWSRIMLVDKALHLLGTV